MNVLFVCSGNKKTGVSPIVKHQADSLVSQGIFIDFYLIQGKGTLSYLKHIFKLRKHLKSKQYQVVHAHYSLSGIVASLAGAKNIVVSLMGSDLIEKSIFRRITKFFVKRIWPVTIVKSEFMNSKTKSKRIVVLPNGVNLELFNCVDKTTARQKLGWSLEKKHILFGSSPERAEKNFDLAKKAIALLDDYDKLEIRFLKDIDSNELYLHYSASDVLLMTSFWEGSPNVIKEAMACNLPIVSTNVGDVSWVVGQTKGCFVTEFDEGQIAENLIKALEFSYNTDRTNGRERIKQLKLDSSSVAKQLIEIYNNGKLNS